MPRCIVKSCVYHKSANWVRDKSSIHLFRVPKDTERREAWRVSLNLGKEDIFANSTICNLHFTPESYDFEKSPFSLHLKQNALPILDIMKMEFKKGICNLCLEERQHCRAIDGNAINALSMLLPKTDFTVIQGPVVCKNCAEMLTRCHDFKVKCLHTYEYVVPLSKKNSVKLDLKAAYRSKNASAGSVESGDQSICGLCMGLVKNVSAVSSMSKKMMRQCLPELSSGFAEMESMSNLVDSLEFNDGNCDGSPPDDQSIQLKNHLKVEFHNARDLSIMEKLGICTRCLGSLENCSHFVTNCLITEKKIRKYCDTLDVHRKGEVELSNVLQFITRGVTSEVAGNSIDEIKVEQQFTSTDEGVIGHTSEMIKLEETFLDDCEHGVEDVKIKNETFMEMDDGKDDFERPFTPKNMAVLEEGSYVPAFIKTEGLLCEENETECKEENVGDEDGQKCLLKDEIEIKMEEKNFTGFEESIILPQQKVETSLERKQSSISNLTGDLTNSNIKHTLTNNNALGITMYHCDSCEYRTKRKGDLKIHRLRHKDRSEVRMYKCDLCSYQTMHKHYLKTHSLKHKDVSELTMYKCDVCLYKTKFKNVLKTHSLMHKDSSEITMYNCDSCLYQTKFKGNLTTHLQTHKDPSEVIMYNCDSCSYQTKFKCALNTHLQTHKDPSELTMYKCDFCLYETRFKSTLTIHLQTHKDPSVEVTSYKCGSCSYQTKFKGYLKVHSLSHKDPSEVTMYKCDTCLFQTKYKKGIKTHLLKHKDLSEVTIYKCASCSYQTDFKGNLKMHMLSHKDPSEVTMYKCDSCSFQTKYKKCLKRHLLKHNGPSE